MAGSSTTRIALAGAGWAARAHSLAASESPGVAIHAVAAGDLGEAEAFAEVVQATPIPVDRLPAGARAVIIATPPDTHAELAIRLLDEGVPVLIETPIATTLDEADDIIDAAARSAVIACYAESLLFSPAMDVAAARARELGRLDHLDVQMVGPTPDWGYFRDPQTAGGALLDLGPHAVAIALVLAGDDAPVGVRCRLGSSREDGADDAARVELRFASDLIAAIDVSWTAESTAWAAQVASATGTVRVEIEPLTSVEVNGEPVALPTRSAATDQRVVDLGFADQMRGFTSMIAGRGGRVCPVGFGRAVLDVICASYASAGKDSAEEPLPFGGRRDLTPMQLLNASGNPQS